MSLDRYQSAVVTGASRGIGTEIVRRLRRNGLSVHAVARSASDLETLAAETGCTPLALDIADRAAVQAALGGLRVDILINNASAAVRSNASWETSAADTTALMDVNLHGTLNCLAAVVPGMKARGLGHIVNMGSMAGTWMFPGMP
jgi:NADP-dependent 3-hydroxy acid dehydrogenase YdfG